MKRTIVIIENSPEESRLFQSMLTTGSQASDYAVICTGTGDEGLSAIGTERPDCVLLDTGLPGQGSAATWNRIRARYPGLPLVMLAGDDVDFDSLEAMRAEGQEYIVKSEASPDTLQAAVNSAILVAQGRQHEEGNRAATAFTVLIIDDNPDDREAFIRSLKKVDERYRCVEAGEGLAGLAMIKEARPDCVLLDYSLPALNGLQVLRRIHEVDAFLPVIMLTGLGNEAVAVQAMKGGAHNYIVKTSLTPGLLHSAIASAVEHGAMERKIDQQRHQIVKQKRALARSDKLNEAIVNSAAYMVVATDIDGTVVLFNPAAERQLGYKAEEIVGARTPLLWLDNDELAKRAEALTESTGVRVAADFGVLSHQAATDGLSRQEWNCVRRNGEHFTAAFTVSALRDGNGPVSGFLISGEDITESKNEQDALRAREELFRGAMEHAPSGMAFIDTGGRFLKVNGALCEMLGYTAGQLQGKHLDTITDPEDIELDLEDARQLLSGKIQSYKVEKRIIREDGGAVHVLLAMALMRHEDGSPNYFMAQFQDISDRKAVERLKSDFVSLVSHELRTPITSIRGAVGLLSTIAGDVLPARGRQLIDIAAKNCDRLVTLVDDILDIDKMAQGQMRFEMKDEDIAALLQEAIEAHRGASEKPGVSIVMEPVPTNLLVHVDAARLVQAVFNLLANATRNSPDNGQIRVGGNRIGGKIRVWVKDQGAGIAPEHAKAILAGERQKRMEGADLGLHIGQQIIERMGGRIGLDSMPGVGSMFWIELPEREAAPTTAMAATPSEGGGQIKRILVCEDDDNLAMLIQLMLAKAGYSADIVHSVPEARRRLMGGNYDAVTLDLTLPLGDGLEFARELHAAPETQDIPIIVVSGSLRDERAGAPENAGIVDWIVKPFDRERLVRSVEKAASSHLRLAHSA
jgi:PAS domain S-box-containing protein